MREEGGAWQRNMKKVLTRHNFCGSISCVKVGRIRIDEQSSHPIYVIYYTKKFKENSSTIDLLESNPN